MVYHSLPVSPLWMNKWVGVASRLCRGCWRHGLTSLPLALCAATPYTWYRPTHTSRIHDVAGADTLGAVDSSSSWRKRTTLIDPTPAWRQPLTSQMWRYRTEHMTLHDLPGYSLQSHSLPCFQIVLDKIDPITVEFVFIFIYYIVTIIFVRVYNASVHNAIVHIFYNLKQIISPLITIF